MKRLFKFTGITFGLCLILMLLAAVPVFGADVAVKYSGPSGQGQLIIYSPTHGLTNLVVSSNGVSTITLAPGVELTVTSADLVVAADGTFGGDVVADTLSATNGAVSALTTYKIGAVSAGSTAITNWGGATTNVFHFTGGLYMSNTVYVAE